MKLSEAWPLFVQELTGLQGRSKVTAIRYTTAKNNMQAFMHDPDLSSLDAQNISKWAESMDRQGIRPVAVNFYLDAISSFCKWAVRRHHMSEEPFYGMKRKDPEAPEPKALKWEDALDVLENIAGTAFWQRDYYLFKFLLHTGARPSEALNLKKDSYDASDAKVIFRSTKGRRPRIIYLPPKFALEFDGGYMPWRDGLWPGSEWLFPTRHGNQLKMEDVQAIPHRYDLRITPYQLRHTFITHVLKKTKNLRLAQELAGHRSIETTARYLRVWDSDKQEAAKILDD